MAGAWIFCLAAALREILEAAARGKAIVSTRVGAEGLELRDGIEIILRDGAAAFALVCVELLADPVRCETLGMAAHEIGSRRYDRRQIVVRIKDEIGNPGGLNKDNHDICFGRPKGANRVEIADAFERLEEGIRHES